MKTKSHTQKIYRFRSTRLLPERKVKKGNRLIKGIGVERNFFSYVLMCSLFFLSSFQISKKRRKRVSGIWVDGV